MTTRRTLPGKERGFTLVELIVAMVVIVVLTSIAVPSYRDHVSQARRSTAQTALMDAASRQEQFALNARTYTTNVGSSGLGMSATTEGGYYTISVKTPDTGCPIAQCYVLLATPAGSQTSDSCGALSIDSSGTRSPTGCW